jgi:hypothetical protein
MRQITSPDSGTDIAAVQPNRNVYLILRHDLFAILFFIVGVSTTIGSNQHIT